MNNKSLFKIKSIFKALNDKLAFLQDPATYSYAKKKMDPKKVEDDIREFVSEEQGISKQQRQTNKDVDKRLNYLEQAIREVSDGQQSQPIEASLLKNNLIAEPIEINDEKLKEIGIQYNPEAKRYQEMEKNESGRKDFVSYENVLQRLKEAEPEKQNDEFSLLSSINENSIGANTSLESILKLLTDKQLSTSTEDVKPDAIPETEDDGKDKKGGGMGGIMGALGFALFAFAPFLLVMAKKFLDKYRQKISDFLEPIFKFVLDDVPKFFTETIPTFFTETLPDFFSEKFDSVKSYLADFMDSITIFMASIKRGVGSALVTVGNLLPGSIGKSIADTGKEMIEEADTTAKGAEERKQKREDERDKKQRFKLLKDQAEEEAKKFIERSNGKYDKYDIQQNEKSGYTIITYTGPTSEFMDFFDTEKSLETGTLVHVKPKTNKDDATPESPETPVVTSKDGEPVASTSNVGSSTDASPIKTPGGSGEGGSEISSGGGSGGGEGSNIGGGGSPSSPSEMQQPAPVSEQSLMTGDQLTKDSMQATAPIETPSQNGGVTTVGTGAANQTGAQAKEGTPHNISDVPDPTPVLGFLADQLFYLKA